METQPLLEAAFLQSFNAIVVTDAELDDGGPFIVLCNPAFCELTGYAVEELIGSGLRMLQGPATDRAVLDELKHCLVTGTFFLGSTVNYRKDGSAYVVQWNISPVHGPSGRIEHFVSVQQNITPRLKAEREADMLGQALNFASDAVMITDDVGCIVFVNPAFEHLTGYPVGDVVGHSPTMLHSGGEAPVYYRELAQASDPQDGVRATFEYRRKDGRVFYADQSLAPVVSADGVVRFVVSIVRDASAPA